METELNAERRSETGKGAARRLRAAGGPRGAVRPGIDATPLTVELAVAPSAPSYAAPTCWSTWWSTTTEHLAIPERSIARHPRGFIHVDFLAVSRSETITVKCAGRGVR